MNLTFLAPLGTGFQLVGLALMVGGMLALGAFAAPAVFSSFPRAEAGEAMTQVFLRFDNVLLGCAVLIIAGEVGRFLGGWIETSTLGMARWVLLAAIVGITLFNSLSLNPTINRLIHHPEFNQNPAVVQEFQHAHHLSEQLYKTALVIGAMALLLSPFLGSSVKST